VKSARDAAEAAIRSPLLEDIDLHGARGILVNVTAGPDLNIGEFTDVGSIIDDFASDAATVVVGTVIDPDLGEELKVTVVATGLGEPLAPRVVVDNAGAGGTASLDGSRDYSHLDTPPKFRRETPQEYEKHDQPTFDRHRSALQQDNLSEDLEKQEMDYLDIPAFLRRQAD